MRACDTPRTGASPLTDDWLADQVELVMTGELAVELTRLPAGPEKERRLPQGQSLFLVAHSNAGPFVPVIVDAAQHPVVGCLLQYSVEFTMTDDVQDAVGKIPARAWSRLTTVTGRSATARGSPS